MGWEIGSVGSGKSVALAEPYRFRYGNDGVRQQYSDVAIRRQYSENAIFGERSA